MMNRYVQVFTAILILLAVGPLAADSLWTSDADKGLCADKKAAKVGDLVTVLIVEGAASSQKASMDFDKDVGHSNDVGVGPLLKLLPELSFSSSQNGSASGQTTMSNKLVTKLTATVTKVLPGGNLEIEGDRSLVTNGEKQEIFFSATVRPEDIGTDNSVTSTSLADVKVWYSGKGPVGDRQREGIVTKLIKWLF